MKKFNLISENEDECYRIYSNGEYNIQMNLDEDDRNKISFSQNGKEIDGEFEFIQDEFINDKFLLKRMYSPTEFKRMGLGELALQFFKEYNSDPKIYVRANDGQTRNDGSHLTGDAPVFCENMKIKKLIEQEPF